MWQVSQPLNSVSRHHARSRKRRKKVHTRRKMYMHVWNKWCCVLVGTNSYQILMVYLLWLYAILISRFLTWWKIIFNRHFTLLCCRVVRCALREYAFPLCCQPSNFSHLTFSRANHTQQRKLTCRDGFEFFLFHSAKLEAYLPPKYISSSYSVSFFLPLLKVWYEFATNLIYNNLKHIIMTDY